MKLSSKRTKDFEQAFQTSCEQLSRPRPLPESGMLEPGALTEPHQPCEQPNTQLPTSTELGLQLA